MTDRPILFSAPMVRAILSGRKTQTRRVLKQAVGPSLSAGIDDDAPGVAELSWLHGDGPGHDVHEAIKRVPCPYGAPGDRLWVRETWGVGCRPCPHEGGVDGLEYRADEAYLDEGDLLPLYRPKDLPDDVCLGDFHSGWRPSIHMFRWASRILLEVTGVRVERLQAISEADAMHEGAEPILVPPDGGSCPHAEGFETLWKSINGAESWDANPWVWVVEFRRAEA